jgi:hypothetical protein
MDDPGTDHIDRRQSDRMSARDGLAQCSATPMRPNTAPDYWTSCVTFQIATNELGVAHEHDSAHLGQTLNLPAQQILALFRD